jgi:hypothetical protein
MDVGVPQGPKPDKRRERGRTQSHANWRVEGTWCSLQAGAGATIADVEAVWSEVELSPMPGAVPSWSTRAITATLSHVVTLADRAIAGALEADPLLARGPNVEAGAVVHNTVRAAVEPAESLAT